MADWKNDIPKWKGNIVEPPESKKEEGYVAGDRPPASWENWFRNAIGKSVEENREELEKLGFDVENIDFSTVENMIAGVDGQLTAHKNNISNPHSVTKAQVGLGNVINTKQASKAEHDALASVVDEKADKIYVDNRVKAPVPEGAEFTDTIATKQSIGLDNVDNIKQASKVEFDAHKAESATQNGYGHIRLQDIPSPEIATKEEVEAGTDNTKFMTPLRVAESIDSRVRIIDNMVELFIAGEWTRFKEMTPWLPGIYTWQDVQKVVREGRANQYFSVGDQLASNYNDGEIIWEVIGIDVDTPTDGQYTHSMTLQTKDCLYDRVFDPGNDNRYINSPIRTHLNGEFLNKLDPELSSVLGKVDKKVAKRDNLGGGQDIFSDKVFLLSRVEVGLGTEGTTTGEKVYPFYNGVADSARIKKLNTSPRSWWLRSPHVDTPHYIRVVKIDGSLAFGGAINTFWVSPACVII